MDRKQEAASDKAHASACLLAPSRRVAARRMVGQLFGLLRPPCDMGTRSIAPIRTPNRTSIGGALCQRHHEETLMIKLTLKVSVTVTHQQLIALGRWAVIAAGLLT